MDNQDCNYCKYFLNIMPVKLSIIQVKYLQPDLFTIVNMNMSDPCAPVFVCKDCHIMINMMV